MGKVKTKHIKRLAQELISKFPDRFSANFEDNKRIVDALVQGATTRVRNQIAGYITHTMTIKHPTASTEIREEIAA